MEEAVPVAHGSLCGVCALNGRRAVLTVERALVNDLFVVMLNLPTSRPASLTVSRVYGTRCGRHTVLHADQGAHSRAILKGVVYLFDRSLWVNH